MNVTDCPYTVGLTEGVTAVCVPAGLTDCVKAVEVLPEKFLSPAYRTVIAWPATARPVLEYDATPPTSVSVSMAVVPS